MYKVKICCLVLILNTVILPLKAQQATLAKQRRDTSFTYVNSLSPVIKKGFTPYIVPSVMVAYGALSLVVPPLKDLNHSIQHQIVTKNPNFSTHADDYLWFVPTAAVYGLNLVGIKGKHSFRDRTMIALIANGIMGVGTIVTKKAVHAERPDGADAESFPSGHTASAFTAAEFLYQEYKDVSPWIGYGGYAVAVATGTLRMYNNHHYLGDVIAGAGVGIISTKLAYTVYPFVARHLFKNYDFKTVAMPTYVPGGGAGFAFVHHFN